jgi:excisionase family DNA binding protein
MPGRGTVTKAVFADQRYHLMLDLLGRKRVALGTLDMDKVRERYSMTVKEAAAAAGVHENAIRQAIAAKRLSSVKDKGEHRLDPAQVEAYKPSKRGPAAPLEVVFGSAPGKRLSISHDGALRDPAKSENVTTARIEAWSTASIVASTSSTGTEGTGKARFWRIEPGSELNEVGLDPFVVRGRFAIVEQSNNVSDALQRFKQDQQLAKLSPEMQKVARDLREKVPSRRSTKAAAHEAIRKTIIGRSK